MPETRTYGRKTAIVSSSRAKEKRFLDEANEIFVTVQRAGYVVAGVWLLLGLVLGLLY